MQGRLRVNHELSAEFLNDGQVRGAGVFIVAVIAAPQQQVQTVPAMVQGCHGAQVRGAIFNVKLRFCVHETSALNEPGFVVVAGQVQHVMSAETVELKSGRQVNAAGFRIHVVGEKAHLRNGIGSRHTQRFQLCSLPGAHREL